MTTGVSDSTAGEPPAVRDAPPAGGWIHVAFKGRRIEAVPNPSRVPLAVGDQVVIEVERGEDLGQVLAVDAPEIRRRRHLLPLRILRVASPEDLARLAEARARDAEALELVKQRVRHFSLPMHLLDAEHQFDGNRITFYFTADHRVDFRELVRDLAGIFRTRIELRQISTREAARRLGGLGFCGRGLCCCSFLSDFERVTLQSARLQRMGLNPTRLSGICGRLLCCLMFEEPPRGSGEHGGCPCAEECPPAADEGAVAGSVAAPREPSAPEERGASERPDPPGKGPDGPSRDGRPAGRP